jgi:hypothetical protein
MRNYRLLTLCCLLALSIVPMDVHAQDGAALTVEHATGRPDTTATVNLLVSNASEIGAMDLALRYDPAVVRFAGFQTGTSAEDALLEANEVEPGLLLLALADSNGLSGDGTLAVLTFDVTGADGDRTAIAVEAVRAYHYELLTDIPMSTTPGELLITGKESPPLVVIALLAVLAVLIVAAAGVLWLVVRSRRR